MGAWPVARKLIFFLCVGVVVLLSITLTALGYTQASRDLQEQAEAALLAEGQSVATAVDAWNAYALVERQAIVGLPSVLRLLATNAGARDADLASADEALASFRTVDPDATALILADAQGQIVVSTEPGSQGLVSQRPAFREALAWRTSITGVSAGTQTGRRDIFRDAPVRAADGRVLGGVVMRSGIHTVQQHAHAPRAQLVLVVDDDASAREVLRRTLERAGWSVTDAKNGREALEQRASGAPPPSSCSTC